MHIVAEEVGIDVSKDWLDVSVGGRKAFRTSNTVGGIEQLLDRIPRAAVTHMESSGGYERLAHHELRLRGYQVRVHNPRKVRRLADVLGVSAKTDGVDARHLSNSGSMLPKPSDKSKERELLCDLSRAIATLKGNSSAYKKRIQTPELDPAALKAFKEVIKVLEAQIRELEKQFSQRMKASPFKGRYILLRSVPAIGPVTARVLISELHEDMSSIRPCQVCSYGALAPLDDASGKTVRNSRLGKGNLHIKAAMYMPALWAIAHENWARGIYDRQKAKGKNHQQAIVPVMRKLLERAAVVLKRGTPWENEHPKP